MDILTKIYHYKREELEHFQRQLPLREIKEKVRDKPEVLDFVGSLQNPRASFAIIAEIKRRSPSKGLLRENFQPEEIARDYQENGASALSILTDEHFFGGHLDYLRKIRCQVAIPLLRKDFIWDPYQVYAAREAGADAILLIAAMLEPRQLEDLQGEAHQLGLSVLVEVHDVAECETALHAGSKLIGVNNRDLKTFEVDISTSERLFPLLGDEAVKVSESGIDSRQALERLKNAGAHAFLIGETFMTAERPGEALRQLIE